MAITVQEAQVIFSADGLAQVQTKAGLAGRALDKTATAAGGLINKLKGVHLNLGGIGSTLAGLGIGAAAGGMMSLAAGAEQTAISMEVFLGSADKAKKLIADLRALDMNSVFGFQQLSESAKLMLNFGVAGEDVFNVLTRLSEVAAGDPMRLEALSRGFGQVTQAGRLMGQENNQLINAGFSPLAEISRTTGEGMASLKKRMEDGGVSVDEVRRAFESATSAGGRFYGLNDRLAASTGGQFSKLKSEVELLAIAIGTELLPEANDLLEWARSFFESTDKIKSKFTDMKNGVREWFAESQEKFEGVGIIVGVTTVHIGDLFKAMFDDITSYGQAFFDWFMQNSSAIGENAARTARNAVKVLTGNTRETVEVTDDFGQKKMITRTTLEQMKPTTEFQAPKSKLGEVPSLMTRIDEELAAARKIKADQLDENPDGEALDALKNDKKRPAARARPSFDAEQSTKEKSQSFSAEALFANLRGSSIAKQINIAQQSLSVQQQQLAAQNNMIAAVGNINTGLT